MATSYGVVGYPAGASNNSVLVTGSSSAWANDFLFVGEGGTSNSVTVANGGQVQKFRPIIGVVASASNNWATVTGTNSLWNTGGDMLVGDAAGQNRLFVNNGGKVTSGANIILGNQSTSSGNLLSVAAAPSPPPTRSAQARLDVRRGNVDFAGGLITADRLLATNAQSSFTFNGGIAHHAQRDDQQRPTSFSARRPAPVQRAKASPIARPSTFRRLRGDALSIHDLGCQCRGDGKQRDCDDQQLLPRVFR